MFDIRHKPASRALTLAAIFLAPSLPALAQKADVVVPIPDVVVSATGVPTPTSQIGSSVTVVTADQIQAQQARTINDVLDNVPGLNIVQSGSPGSTTSVFIRGTNSNHVKVLVDGIDVSDPSSGSGTFDFGQLLVGDIERIEVLRGPQSGLYGSDAIGGVISITTKKGSGPAKVTASVEGGSFGTSQEKFGVSGSNQVFNYAFNVGHFLSVATPVVPAYMLPPSQKAADNFYDNVTASGRFGVDISDTFAVNTILRYTTSTLLFNSYGIGTADADRSQQVDNQFYSREEAVWHSLDNRFRTTLGVAYSDTSTNTIQSPEDGVAPTTYIGQRLKFDLKQEIGIVEGEKLILGGEWQNDSMDTGTATYSVENKAVYAELESKLFDHFAVASNIRYDDNENFGGHATYRIAPTYTIAATDTQLKASYGTGFKSPSLSDLYQNYPAFGFYANPNLQPETSTGYDIGFEQPFLKDRIRIGSTYFHNDITNLIDYNATYTSLVNVGHAETYGTESFASYKVSDQFTIRADYTYTIARDLIADIDLARRPRDKATLQGNWTPFDKFHLSGTLLYVSSWLDVNPLTYASQTAPGYATVNFAASYELTKQATIFARVNNLFNRQYEDPLGYLHPGLAAYAGVRITSF